MEKGYENDYKNYKKLLEGIANHQADIVGNRIRERLGVLKETDFSVKNPLK